MKPLNLFIILCLMFWGFNSCEKDEPTTTVDEVSLSQQETQAEETLSDIDILVDEALDLNFNTLKSATIESPESLGDYPVITVNKNSNPQVLSIDFGTACTGKDGKVRSGKIIVTSTSFNTFPSVRDKSFENYTVDGKKVEGNISKTISKDQENNIRTAVIQENITISFPDNEGVTTRVANLTRQYVRNPLLNRNDNQVVSWGSVQFTRKSGVKLTKIITTANPLIFNMACHHIVSGIISFSTSNDRSWSIDYGNGDCDNKATLTMGEKTKEIRIH